MSAEGHYSRSVLPRDLPTLWTLIPMEVFCPYCRATVCTEVVFQRGLGAVLSCLGLTAVGCWLCCLYPCWMERCQDILHVCPGCHRVLGRKEVVRC